MRRNSTLTPVEFLNEIYAETRNCLAMEFQGNSRLKHSEKYTSWYHGKVSIIHLAVSDSIIFQNGYMPLALSFHGGTMTLAYSHERREERKKRKKREVGKKEKILPVKVIFDLKIHLVCAFIALKMKAI